MQQSSTTRKPAASLPKTVLLKKIWTAVGRAGFRAGDTDMIWIKHTGNTYIQHASEEQLQALLEALPAELEMLQQKRREERERSYMIQAERMNKIESLALEYGHRPSREGSFIVCSACRAAWCSDHSPNLRVVCSGGS